MPNKVLIIQNALTQLEGQIQASSLSAEKKKVVLSRVSEVDLNLIVDLCEHASTPLTKGNVMYIFCFVAGIDTQLIARIFNVEPATIYTVRYRLRARFGAVIVSPF